ncbi:MAG: Rrf2 family transcriptional regulator [Actinobacteria bacterium]|nr:Rrf2 family transcriptional regulator [Actinomycetota bacterium]
MLSQSCKYGIRAVIYLALKEKEGFVSINEISKNLDVPFHFLTKTLQMLTQKKLLQSNKGPKGGVRLSISAERITLMEIVLAIDGAKLFEQCIIGLPGCGVLKSCPLHEEWTAALEIIKRTLNEKTLRHLARRVIDESLRITDLNNADFLSALD